MMVAELSAYDLEQGFKRPYRTRVKHAFCGFVSPMRITDAVSMALDPASKTDTYCLLCGRRLPSNQFTWFGSEDQVGS
jgi:hypothetical protein